MKKKAILCSIFLLFMLCLVSCGDKDVGSDPDDKYVAIVGSDYVYEKLTKIVYSSERTSDGYFIHSAYYAPNGKPFKYDVEKGYMYEIVDDGATEMTILNIQTNTLETIKLDGLN